jgi:hypothetical protein
VAARSTPPCPKEGIACDAAAGVAPACAAPAVGRRKSRGRSIRLGQTRPFPNCTREFDSIKYAYAKYT